MRTIGPRIVFILLGLVLILAGVSIQIFYPAAGSPSPWLQLARDLLITCGVGVGSVALVDFIWGSLGGEPLSIEIARLGSLNDLLADSTKAGLQRVHPKVSGAPNPRWETVINSCKASIDLCGYQLLDLVDSQATLDALVARADAGVKVRVLLYDPENSKALSVAASNVNLNAMKSMMMHSMERFSEANSKLPENKQFELVHISDLSPLAPSLIRGVWLQDILVG